MHTLAVGAAVAPSVIETYISHFSFKRSNLSLLTDRAEQYLKRKDLHHKPTAHISYHEGLQLVRQFLRYASLQTVEELQHFTAQKVPVPRWVRTENVEIPAECIGKAAEQLQKELGPKGIQQVGGRTWWQVRRRGAPLRAEWIEMRKDYTRRKRLGDKGKRVILYVHGGAYYFGSVDAHRYQMQRHARKLRARVFAPRYRLAPQFPFPCGLHDCLAAYLFLLRVQDPSTIILMGDSAGGGMCLSMLVVLRDGGHPLPAGVVLLSPWVDLTHSFPSVAGDSQLDYIPPHGFLQKPSMAWPPPTAEDMQVLQGDGAERSIGRRGKSFDQRPRNSASKQEQQRSSGAGEERKVQRPVQGFSEYGKARSSKIQVDRQSRMQATTGQTPLENAPPVHGRSLSIMLDGHLVEIKDQIQMYATNELISHPLVSPVLQPSLGGLPPMLIMVGGGEMLRDEQIYLAHKAAHPTKYPPSDAHLDSYDGARELVSKYEGTDVHLQVWEDLCHVAPTLSWTRPAKRMYSAAAQFGTWALATAQHMQVEDTDDDDESSVNSDSAAEDDSVNGSGRGLTEDKEFLNKVGKPGDPLPPFNDHKIRQLVDRNGRITPLGPTSSLPALQLQPDDVGVIKEGPVRKWMAAKAEWDSKFAKEKKKVKEQRLREMTQSDDAWAPDETPPPTAVAGMRNIDMHREKRRNGWGLSLWTLWGGKHDEQFERQRRASNAGRRRP